MSGDDEPTEDWRTNLLRPRLSTAISRAETALSNLGATSGNPLSGPLEAIEDGAWESPSAERTRFIGDLDGAGSEVKTAFDNAVTELNGDLNAEPTEIDVVNDPGNAWKTSYSGIELRSGYSQYGPF